MKTGANPASPARADELLQRAERLTAEHRDLIAEIDKAKRPGFNQPRGVIAGKAGAGPALKSPFRDFGHFLRSVRECPGEGGNWHNHDSMKSWMHQVEAQRKSLPTGMNETVGGDGGYLVPPEFANTVLMRMYDNPLLGMTTLFSLAKSNHLRIPSVNETSRATGSRYGGVVSYWEGEEDEDTLSKANLNMLDIFARRCSAAVRATDELLADSDYAIEQFLNIVVPSELAFRVGEAIVRGDGVNKPEGILNSPSKVTVSKEPGQGAATILAENINAMWTRLHESCQEDSVWLVEKSTFAQLDQMTLGTAGAQMVVYLPQGGLSAPRYATLKGRPVLPVEFCSAVGTEGDIILFSPSTFLSVARGALQTAVSMHVYFLAHSQVFRFSLRFGGQSWWRSDLTPFSGAATRSNIVTLQTRS